MSRKPQALFRALTFIDVTIAHYLRFQFDATWDANGVEANFLTWEDESQFYRLQGCYVAVL